MATLNWSQIETLTAEPNAKLCGMTSIWLLKLVDWKTCANLLLELASGDFGDRASFVLVFSSAESKLPFSLFPRLLRSNLRTFFVSSSASIGRLFDWFKWHSMVVWLTALFVNAGRLLSHISARGSIFILETMICCPRNTIQIVRLTRFLCRLLNKHTLFFTANKKTSGKQIRQSINFNKQRTTVTVRTNEQNMNDKIRQASDCVLWFHRNVLRFSM